MVAARIRMFSHYVGACGLLIALGASCDNGIIASPSGEDAGATPDGGGDAATATDGAMPEVDAGPRPAAYGLDVRPANPTCKPPPRPAPAATVTFDEVYPGMVLTDGPMMLAQAPGDLTRWFVATRDGRLLSFPSNGLTPAVSVANLAALSGLTVQTAGESGLLGFAFHPKFAQNGRVYISWNSGDGPEPSFMKSRIGYLTSTDNGATFTSYTNLLAFDQPFSNHNGGGIAFGKDGYLYFSFGDGGGGDIVNGQTRTAFFSKILRVDVDVPSGQPYKIPTDNPYATTAGYEPATFAYGFRNPFRFSFDRATGELWVGDVGEVRWEEIDLVKPGGNYGWPCREGNHDYALHPLQCLRGTQNLEAPVIEHEHVAGVSANRSITGGVVYRGKAIPSLVGTYVYGDFQTTELFALSFNPVTAASESRVLNPSGPAGYWVHFAEDGDGEVFAVDLYGHIYKMKPTTVTQDTFPQRLSQTGCVEPASPTKPAAGLLPFGVNVQLWSDGAEKTRHLALPDGATITAAPSGHFDLPPGSVLMKSFGFAGKPIETRLLMRHDDGVWAGYSYEWLDDGSDAILLPSSKQKQLVDRSWSFPSRADCVRCHTEAAGRSLGLEAGQLNRDFVYTSTNRISNQLATLEHIGVFSAPLGALTAAVLPPLASAAPLADRARAYLHVNCGNCHQPSGGGGGDVDLRFSTAFADTKSCDVAGERGDFGVDGAKRIVPGLPSKSLLSLRSHALGAGRMPPLGSNVVDVSGLTVVDGWISSLTACP